VPELEFGDGIEIIEEKSPVNDFQGKEAKFPFRPSGYVQSARPINTERSILAPLEVAVGQPSLVHFCHQISKL
jgi:hypothetical protein